MRLVVSSFLLFLVFTGAAIHAAEAWRPWPTLFLNVTKPTTISGVPDPNLGSSKKYEGSSEFVHLRYHMGPVLTANITVHPIWYGAWIPSQKRIIRAFIRSITPSTGAEAPAPSVAGWWKTVRLYTDQTGSNITAVVRLGSEKNDRRYSHGKRLTRLSVQSIVRTAVSARNRPLPVNPRGGFYLLLTSPDVEMEGFCGSVCGFHYFTFPSVVGYTLPYAWVGNSGGRCPEVCAYPFAIPAYVPGRQPERAPNGDVGVDGMVSVIGHELAEMASNPLINAWYAGGDPSFPTEIADLCEGIYGTGGGGAYTGQLLVDGRSGGSYNLNGVGGRKFLVQWVWNPYLKYCTGPNALDL
ncbi:hypothetical protein AXF42_Ash014447 [Apostasia shenzhenica]|uniref:Protein EXORDIUM-like 3 n=1 Tax=Apostasia shenzhenica TaxID=1088818 RepID=A0A2H9ZWI9_9ASPA|nr:hypothetical protein AXF42_Ash014447 [Apostasia shenzhenica]